MVDVRLNLDQQHMVTANKADCSVLSWKEHSQLIKEPYCVLPWDAGELSCGELCFPWPALPSHQFQRHLGKLKSVLPRWSGT